MTVFRTIDMAPAQMRYALGYACVCAWAVILLLAPVFDTTGTIKAAPASMLPGLVTCLASLLFAKRFPSITGRTGAVALASILMAGGTLLSTFPATAPAPTARLAGLVLSGMFAIILIMAWFDVFARLKPRAVIVLAGCSVTGAAVMCWGILSLSPAASSALLSLLPMISFVMLPTPEDRKIGKHAENVPSDESPRPAEGRSIAEIVAAALPVRTLIGLAITFFIVDALGTLAPVFGPFSSVVSPLSLLAPLGVTAFFVASAFFVRRRLDPTILYKVLMFVSAAIVLLIAFSLGINASLVFCTALVAEAMMWTVLALLAKKTPVVPHHVFAIGWIAECVGRTLGQTTAPLFIGHPEAFSAVALMLILVAVGFAFSERSLVIDVGFEDEIADEPTGTLTQEGPAKAADGRRASASENAESGDGVADNARPSSTAASAETEAAASGTAFSVSEGPSGSTASVEAEGIPSGALPTGIKGIPGEATHGSTANSDAQNENAPSPLDAFVASYDISRRERDVLELWLAGRGLKYIENALFISESTVKSHLRSIYRKCDTHSRDEIISLFERSSR